MTRSAFWVCCVVIAAMVAASVYALNVVPADTRVAIHFSLDGTPDGFAGPGFAFSILPLAAAAALALFALVPRYSPATGIPSASRPAYSIFSVAIILVLAGAHALIIAKAVGVELSVTRWIAGALGVMFLVTGNYATTIRPNAVFGVRLPRTLASARVWAKTHRLFGWMSVVLGLGLMGLAVSGWSDRDISIAMLAAIAAMLVVVIGHSWWIARREPGTLS